MLGRVLSAGGIKDPSVLGMGDTLEFETLFCLRFPDERGKPVAGLKRETLENGAWSFRKDGKEVVLFKPSVSAVSEERAPAMAGWFPAVEFILTFAGRSLRAVAFPKYF